MSAIAKLKVFMSHFNMPKHEAIEDMYVSNMLTKAEAYALYLLCPNTVKAIEQVQDIHKSHLGLTPQKACDCAFHIDILNRFQYNFISNLINTDGLYGELN